MIASKTSTPDNWLDEQGDVLYRYALKRFRDKSLAEEMVQETLLAALQSSGSFADPSSERTWLVGILKHKIVDHYGRISRQSAFDPSADLAFEHGGLFRESDEWVDHWKPDLGPSEWRLSPETALVRKEFWEAPTRCLDNLPDRAFTLRE
jgi:RNA polymerase sigma-70 factor (ECF subfamily)